MTPHKIIVGLLALTGIAAGYHHVFGATQISLDAATAKHVVWQKPTTDAGWAEDVKQENFDIKSTDVLQEMILVHTAQLKKEEAEFVKYQECSQCILYEKKQQLQQAYLDAPAAWIDQEAQNAAVTETDQRQWEIEKIEQSIERMNHELDLRARGVVVPDKLNKAGKPATKSALQKVAPKMVRHIND